MIFHNINIIYFQSGIIRKLRHKTTQGNYTTIGATLRNNEEQTYHKEIILCNADKNVKSSKPSN